MRIRSVKPGFCTSEAIAELTVECELHFIKLWMYADDHGKGIDNPRLLKAALWPLRDEVTLEDIEGWQKELVHRGRIIRYSVEGKRYFAVSRWPEHQKPQHPKDSEYPDPSEDDGSAPPPDGKPHESFSKPHEKPPVSSTEKERDWEVGGGDVVGEGASSGEPSDDFVEFWNLYPKRNGKKIGKAQARTAWKRLSNAARHQALVAVGNYRKACDQGLTIAKDPQRFLANKFFEDWLEPAVPDERKAKSNVVAMPSPYGPKPPNPFDEDPTCEHGQSTRLVCRECEVKEAK